MVEVQIQNDLLDQLKKLGEKEFEWLLLQLDVDSTYIPSPEAPLIKRAIAVINYLKQHKDGLQLLRRYLEELPPPPTLRESSELVLLSKVKGFWIDRFLKKLPNYEVFIPLNLEERFSTVSNPFHGVEEFSNQSDQALSPGTEITDIFNWMGTGRTLLILGEPGSGKTTTLLELAQSLIACAAKHKDEPLPVVLNLSSWTGDRRRPDKQDLGASFAAWLVKELNNKYQVSKTLGRNWIDNQKLLLLLDGLDEVKAEHRKTCVEAINHFMQEHGETELVICSRNQDYEALPVRLVLRTAIYVQPLTPEQITQYLDRTGTQLTALKTLLQKDPVLKELARTPLMLSVMTLAYQGASVADIPTDSSLEERRSQLFAQYIERMLDRKQGIRIYSDSNTKHWLTYLAQRMFQDSQTIFLIERMQLTWLTRKQKWIYRISVVLTVGLLIVLTVLLVDWFGDLIPGRNLITRVEARVDAIAPILNNGRFIIACIGLMAGLIVGLKRTIEPIETLKWSWARARNGLLVGLRRWSIIGIRYGFYSGLIIGVIAAAINTQSLSTLIKTPELLIWGQVGSIAGVIAGMIAGSIIGVIAGPHVWLTDGFHPLKPRLQRAVLCGLIAGGVVDSLDGGSLVLGIAAALGVGSVAGLSRGMSDRLVFRLAQGLVVGLTAGLMLGLGNGAVWLVGVLLLKAHPVGLFTTWVSNGLSVGATAGLLLGVIARLKEKTQPVSTLQDPRTVRNWLLHSLQKGLTIGGIAALVSGLVLWLLLGSHNFLAVQVIAWLTNRLGFGLVIVLTEAPLATFIGVMTGVIAGVELGALIGALSGGLRGPSIERSAVPNQGIWRSIKYVGNFSLIGGLVLGLIFGLSNLLAGAVVARTVPSLDDWLHSWLNSGLFLAILSGLIPGAACIQHFILRAMLWRNGSIPWNYARFLDYAVDRIFLQKVGGGYIFIHHLVLEHFAQRPIQE